MDYDPRMKSSIKDAEALHPLQQHFGELERNNNFQSHCSSKRFTHTHTHTENTLQLCTVYHRLMKSSHQHCHLLIRIT